MLSAKMLGEWVRENPDREATVVKETSQWYKTKASFSLPEGVELLVRDQGPHTVAFVEKTGSMVGKMSTAWFCRIAK